MNNKEQNITLGHRGWLSSPFQVKKTPTHFLNIHKKSQQRQKGHLQQLQRQVQINDPSQVANPKFARKNSNILEFESSSPHKPQTAPHSSRAIAQKHKKTQNQKSKIHSKSIHIETKEFVRNIPQKNLKSTEPIKESLQRYRKCPTEKTNISKRESFCLGQQNRIAQKDSDHIKTMAVTVSPHIYKRQLLFLKPHMRNMSSSQNGLSSTKNQGYYENNSNKQLQQQKNLMYRQMSKSFQINHLHQTQIRKSQICEKKHKTKTYEGSFSKKVKTNSFSYGYQPQIIQYSTEYGVDFDGQNSSNRKSSEIQLNHPTQQSGNAYGESITEKNETQINFIDNAESGNRFVGQKTMRRETKNESLYLKKKRPNLAVLRNKLNTYFRKANSSTDKAAIIKLEPQTFRIED